MRHGPSFCLPAAISPVQHAAARRSYHARHGTDLDQMKQGTARIWTCPFALTLVLGVQHKRQPASVSRAEGGMRRCDARLQEHHAPVREHLILDGVMRRPRERPSVSPSEDAKIAVKTAHKERGSKPP